MKMMKSDGSTEKYVEAKDTMRQIWDYVGKEFKLLMSEGKLVGFDETVLTAAELTKLKEIGNTLGVL